MYKQVISPILDRLDSETWHHRAREAMHYAELSSFTLSILEKFAYRGKRFVDKRLKVSLSGVDFENPLIVGAGWDKEARSVKALWQLGFAGVEIGSVLEHRQPGNPRPRQFMLAPGVAINWLGFNSPGMEIVAKNLDRYLGSGIPIGISIGINRDVPHEKAPNAYAVVAKRLYKYGDYFVINVSSPNTPGLRELQKKGYENDIIQAVYEAMDGFGHRKPLYVKIAPELSYEAIDGILGVALDNKINGIIATNTADIPEMKAKYGERWRNQPGGLSGDDIEFRRLATDNISYIYKNAGKELEVIGVGGINDVDTALEKIKAGAKALQIVTGIRGEGTTLPGRINHGIAAYMDREGIKNISELVGVEA